MNIRILQELQRNQSTQPLVLNLVEAALDITQILHENTGDQLTGPLEKFQDAVTQLAVHAPAISQFAASPREASVVIATHILIKRSRRI